MAKPKKRPDKRYVFPPEAQDAQATLIHFALTSLAGLELPLQLQVVAVVAALASVHGEDVEPPPRKKRPKK